MGQLGRENFDRVSPRPCFPYLALCDGISILFFVGILSSIWIVDLTICFGHFAAILLLLRIEVIKFWNFAIECRHSSLFFAKISLHCASFI